MRITSWWSFRFASAKSTNTDADFTHFTPAKVQILTVRAPLVRATLLRSSFYLLYWYKSTHADTSHRLSTPPSAIGRAEAAGVRVACWEWVFFFCIYLLIFNCSII
jgi:hypothetical protein